MKADPKTVCETNGERGRPKPSFDPYKAELNRLLVSGSAPANLTSAAELLAKWGADNKDDLLKRYGIKKALGVSAIRKRLDKRIVNPKAYKEAQRARSQLPGLMNVELAAE